MGEIQQYGRDVKAPPVSHRAPRFHAVSGEGKQPLSEQVELRVIRFLASLICLVVAAYYFWSSHDWVVFLILVAVATERMGIWEAIGLSQRRLGQTQKKENRED